MTLLDFKKCHKTLKRTQGAASMDLWTLFGFEHFYFSKISFNVVF